MESRENRLPAPDAGVSEHEHADGTVHSHEHTHDGHDHTHAPDEAHGHVHTHADGTVHCHGHTHDGHDHAHEPGTAHGHVHTQTKAVLNRLARAIGHLEYVRRMVEEGRDCTEVLVQLAAVRSALSGTARVILKDHLEHCVGDGDSEALQALNEAIDKFMN